MLKAFLQHIPGARIGVMDAARVHASGKLGLTKDLLLR